MTAVLLSRTLALWRKKESCSPHGSYGVLGTSMV